MSLLFKNIAKSISKLTFAGLALCSFSLPALAELKVVTTFTIIADMAENVGGEHVEVTSITRPGAEIHNYQPTPRDLIGAQRADLILWNGLNLELWFEQFFQNLQNIPSITVTDGVEPISISGGEYDGKPNPHAWMSLTNAEIYVNNIRDAFIEYDADNADAYTQNAGIYIEQLRAAIDPLKDQLADVPEAQRWLVTSEGAFSYLARDLDLKEAFLWSINADQQGTPSQVRDLIDLVRANEITAVFSESTVSAEPAKQIARETGVAYGGVLFVDSLSDADGEVPTYLDLLRVTTSTIAKSLAQ